MFGKVDRHADPGRLFPGRRFYMTSREYYRECERLYLQVDWNNRESIHRYNEAVRQLRKQREKEEEEKNE